MAAQNDTLVAVRKAPAEPAGPTDHGFTPAHASISMPGDAMRPTFEDGDELAVDLGDARVHSGGGVYVLDFDGGPAVRRVSATQRGTWILHCDNRDCHDEEVPAGAVRVLGRVVAFRGLRAL